MPRRAPAPTSRITARSGLRELAAFLEANPDVPVPLRGAPIILNAVGADAEIFAAVDRIAGLLNVPAARGGHYTASRLFGPIEYRAVAIPAAWNADYEARHSYDTNITLAPAGQAPTA